jgi:hypothetical protein
VLFDVRIHQPEAAGVVPGDAVIVRHSGRYLGDGEEKLVLVKARVHLDTSNESSETQGAGHDEQ